MCQICWFYCGFHGGSFFLVSLILVYMVDMVDMMGFSDPLLYMRVRGDVCVIFFVYPYETHHIHHVDEYK